MKKSLIWLMAGLAVFPAVALAQESKSETTLPKVNSKTQTKAEAAKLIAAKAEKMTALRDESQKVVARMSTLKIDGSQESSRALQEMADALKSINDQLKTLQGEIEEIKGWIEGQNEALPIMTADILDLKRNKPSTYMQFQYRSTNRPALANDQSSFNLRRARIGIGQVVDPKTSIKLSFDFATGAQQSAGQLRDAQLIYQVTPAEDTAGISITAGQFPLLLGYELLRSSSEREMPERATYNTTLFNGERSQGLQLTYGMGPNVTAQAAVVNSLTYGDPEQSAKSPATNGRRAAVLGGVRYHTPKMEVGASVYRGSRPTFDTGHKLSAASSAASPNVVAPEVQRTFIYVDGTYVGLILPQIFVRGEYMTGKDRNNLGNYKIGNTYGQVNMRGWQAQLGYNFNSRNQINFRIDEFNPNTAGSKNVTKTYGVNYLYYINAGVRIGFAVEEVRAPTSSYWVTTIRSQFKF
ncbi:MAG: hypothetical protein K8R88_08060 [Armatimonadetes bacterium]|nr:hypothetical protein [Armatimonadota bacterium]